MTTDKLVEIVARNFAARKMGLVRDEYGERLSDELWLQEVPNALDAIKILHRAGWSHSSEAGARK